MRDLIAVGAGEVFEKYWLPTIKKSRKVRLAGVVESAGERRENIRKFLPEKTRLASCLYDIRENVSEETIVLVLTPDHFSVVQTLVEMGFRKIVIEKPLVSRDHEIPQILALISFYHLQVYAVDMYIPKAFPLGMVCGAFSFEDPRVALFSGAPHCLGPDWSLGKIEGISVSVVEGGDLGIPSLLRRSWLLDNPEVGGMLRDLGTHAFAPLVNAGLLGADFEISHTTLAKLTADHSGIEPVTNHTDVEMYVAVQLAWNDTPIHAVFGKLPQQGGEWSISVRGSKGMFFAGLRSGQSAIVVLNNGLLTQIRSIVTPMEFVLEEVSMFYSGLLPAFDGNIGAIRTSLEINQKIREAYFSAR